MKAGFFETDITPSIGMERPATYYKIYIEKINDPLKARAVVVDDGKTKIAMVGVDICAIPGDITEKVRAALPGMNVMLSASHTHYGGPARLARDAEKMPELIRKLVFEESVCADPDYTSHLVSQIVTAIKMADMKREDVIFSFGRGRVDGVTFNRGFKMKNGHRATHPGKGNPEIIEPFEPIDTEAGAVGIWRKSDESFLGCIVNFNCHGTCDGTGATADWPGQMARTIKAVMGEDSGVVYLYGCAGDITQIDNQSLSPIVPGETGPLSAKIVGVSVGAEMLKILMKAKKGEISTLGCVYSSLKIPRRKPSEKSLKEALEIVNRWKRDTPFHFAKERLILEYVIEHFPLYEMFLQTIQLGPLVIEAIPGELFCGIGLAVKKRSKFPFTWVSSLANDTCGYVPTRAAFDPETGGGYETRLTSGTCLIPETADLIADEAEKQIARLVPDEVPIGPQVEPRRVVWDFSCNSAELE